MNQDNGPPTMEQVLGNKRCSPLTLKEFEGYLIHEEHSVENLQFTVWYRSYCERFDALAPEYKALSDAPAERYTQFMTPAGSIRTANSIMGDEKPDSWWKSLVRRRSSFSSARSMNGDLEKGENEPALNENGHPRDDDHISLRSAAAPGTPAFSDSTAFPQTSRSGAGADTFSINTTDTKRSRFPKIQFPGLAPLMTIGSRKELPADTPLPFIDEIKLVTTTFFLPGSAKELNIDARLRRHVLKYLQPTLEDGSKGEPITTHPDVFKDVAEHVLGLMERSLPHYMQWAKGNTNTPKRLFWTAVGIVDMGLGVMFAMIILYFARSRWWRIFSFFFFWFGSMQAYSAYFYFCSQVHGRTSRQLYPWELTDTVNDSSDGLDLSAPKTDAFATTGNKSSTGAAANDKGLAGLQESLPFLFEPGVNPFEEKSSKNETATTASATPASKDAAKSTPSTRRMPQFRSKFWASMRTKDGKRIKMFGPERIVEDPYIKALHNKQMKEILIFGTVVTFAFVCAMVAIPERQPLR